MALASGWREHRLAWDDKGAFGGRWQSKDSKCDCEEFGLISATVSKPISFDAGWTHQLCYAIASIKIPNVNFGTQPTDSAVLAAGTTQIRTLSQALALPKTGNSFM